MTKESKDGQSRRDFLKIAGTAAPAAAVAAVATGSEAEAAETDPGETRLRDTAHTRTYLATARF